MEGEGGNSDSEERYGQEVDGTSDEVGGEDQQEGGEVADTGIYTEVRYESG